jgi:hypothetical protein
MYLLYSNITFIIQPSANVRNQHDISCPLVIGTENCQQRNELTTEKLIINHSHVHIELQHMACFQFK